MKYLKYFEARGGAINDVGDGSNLIQHLNDKLNILGITVNRDGGSLANIKLVFNLDFLNKKFSILHISTLLYPTREWITTATPNFNGEAIGQNIKTLSYILSKGFKPFTNEGIFKHFYERLGDKFNSFNNTFVGKGNSSSSGNVDYIKSEDDSDNVPDSIDCREIILEYLEANKNYDGDVVIPQSSIDMVNYVINYFNNDQKLQHELIHGIEHYNPILYGKIKNIDTDMASSMQGMGFND